MRQSVDKLSIQDPTRADLFLQKLWLNHGTPFLECMQSFGKRMFEQVAYIEQHGGEQFATQRKDLITKLEHATYEKTVVIVNSEGLSEQLKAA